MSDNERKNIGCGWKSKTKKGETILSIALEYDKLVPDKQGIVKLAAFKNDYKTEEKHPDYKIYPKKEYDGNKAAPAARPKPTAPTFDDF